MDFIIKLPPSKKPIIYVTFNSVIVAVDRLIKNIIFIPFKESVNADKLVYIFLRSIVLEYTLPNKLITD